MNRIEQISILSITLWTQTFALEAPCYGYGSNFGSNVDYMQNDYTRVVSQKVGNSSSEVYLGVLKFFIWG
jgi:hypothetical protein